MPAIIAAGPLIGAAVGAIGIGTSLYQQKEAQDKAKEQAEAAQRASQERARLSAFGPQPGVPQARNLATGGGFTGPTTVQHPLYSFTEPRLQGVSDYLSTNLQRMQEGKYPAYLSEALPTMRKGMERGLQETYYGGGLKGPGLFEQARSTGAAMGMGPQPTLARENKVMMQYATDAASIDEFLTKMGVDVMREEAGRIPYMAMQMPQGPPVSVFGPQPIAGFPGVPQDWSGAYQTAEAAPWLAGAGGQGGWDLGGIMSDVSNLFGDRDPYPGYTGFTPPYLDPSYSAPTFGGTGGQVYGSQQFGTTWSPFVDPTQVGTDWGSPAPWEVHRFQ